MVFVLLFGINNILNEKTVDLSVVKGKDLSLSIHINSHDMSEVMSKNRPWSCYTGFQVVSDSKVQSIPTFDVPINIWLLRRYSRMSFTPEFSLDYA